MRKSTIGHEPRALNGNELTLGHKREKTALGREVRAPNGKEITLSHQ